MKVRVRSLFILVVLVVLLTVAAAPMRQDGEPTLTEAQLVIVGLIASALTWVLKLIISRGYNPPREQMAIGLYVVSFAVAILFTPMTFPAFPPFVDAPTFVAALLNYIVMLLTLATPVVGVAYLVYNIFLKRVLDGTVVAFKR